MYNYDPTARNMHIIFHEQAVYKRGTKMEKSSFDDVKIATELYHFLLRVFWEQKQKRSRMGFYRVTHDEALNVHIHPEK